MEIIKLFFFEVKIKNIAKISEVNKKTVKTIILSVLRCIKKFVKKNSFLLGGDEIIVEMDESLFGKRKYNRGRIKKQSWVVGIIERTEYRRIQLCVVKKKKQTDTFESY
ncbi:hypothetical protein COBT_002354 [Conglomerata obtusa]